MTEHKCHCGAMFDGYGAYAEHKEACHALALQVVSAARFVPLSHAPRCNSIHGNCRCYASPLEQALAEFDAERGQDA